MAMLRCLLISVIVFVAAELISARTLQTFVGDEIPQKLVVGTPGIFENSDSLVLNGNVLTRNADYWYSASDRSFDLSKLARISSDTLVVIYSLLPQWVGKSYGRDIPEVIASTAPTPIPAEPTALPSGAPAGQEVKLSGAKTFRFSARNSGGNDFGQSLDLKITGELAPGLRLTGALSDRGYDPAYGTATSRLNELDRLNLQLSSQRLLARIGDIALMDAFGGPNKNVSGASLALAYPSWRATAAAARPKGRFSSITLVGENGYQGPYQVGPRGSAQPIVPGSEAVYLDGRRLERGGEKDYTIEYPSGQITFGVGYPIDSRSRIEIDFEPLATSYRQELLTTGGGVSLHDSTVTVYAEVLREGDDREQLLLGELTDSDRQSLEAAGDLNSYRTGVQRDTAGDYVLVPDSLPDSVFQYVGNRQGDYAVTFSFVGTGKGTYQFLGSNTYQYVGAAAGDYVPVIQIPRPERTDYYRSALDVRTRIGTVHADIRQSAYDKNLWSSRDEADNNGLYYSLGYSKEWQWHNQANEVRFARREREATFRQRARLNEADFNREYLLPTGYVANSTEMLHEGGLTASPLEWLTITPTLSQLTYRNSFESTVGGVALRIKPAERLRLTSRWADIAANLDTATATRAGEGRMFAATASYRLTQRYSVETAFEHDNRTDSYLGYLKGTRFDRWGAGLVSETEELRYERYEEDSLVGTWSPSATRDRVMASSARKLGAFSYSAAAAWQHVDDLASRETNFLGRTSLSYANTRQRLNINSSYLVSEELRNARGISYLEVEPGRGNYILEDGRYIPDPDGNYIQVEELLSNRARVRRGEKSFAFAKEWRAAEVRFSSSIHEELLESGSRKVWWVIPFWSDESQPYLFFSRHYDASVRLLPWRSFHAVNVLVTDDIERRSIVDSERERRDGKASLTLKQAIAELYFDEQFEIFRTDRDSYYSGVGAVDGFRIATTVRRTLPQIELSGGAAFRQAQAATDERSRLYSLLLGSRLKVLQQGELRADLELYRQELSGALAGYSYQLTDNKYGSRGAVWTFGSNYGIRKGMKLNVSLTGRHSDDRPGRVTGRGEVVASF